MRRIAALCALVMISTPANAELMQACSDRSNPTGMVQACSVLIADGSAPQNMLGLAYLYRCQAKDLLGQPGDALADCLASRDLIPEEFQLFNSLSIVYRRLGRPDEALAAAQQAMDLAPDKHAAWNGRANARCDLGLYEESYSDRLKALDLGRFTAKGVQRLLKDKGYYKAKIDGDFGRGSRAALRAWTKAGCP